MNVAFDLTQIPIEKTGIGIEAMHLIDELIALNAEHPRHNFFFFAQDDDPVWPERIANRERCTLVAIDSRRFRILPLRFFFEQVLLPRRCRRLNIDLIFSFHYTIPYLTSIDRIVIIPDMTFYLFPELHQRIKRIYFKSLIPLSLKRSHRIVTISESTRKDLLTRFRHLDEGKIDVIHLGVDTQPKLPVQAREHLHSFGLIEKKYFLYVGTLEPRKNIPRLIDAFRQVLASHPEETREFKLVLVGKKGWFYDAIFKRIVDYGLEERVVVTGYVDEEVKRSLLMHAFAFVYPSFYEGFGLPILEAMIVGVPVITGNLSSLPEVAGDAALLVNPNNCEEIAESMTRLLSDPGLTAELSQRSIARAKKFSWRHTAEKIMHTFRGPEGDPDIQASK
ncbi:MAG: glycosyltransferase family 4 protein [Candidatus Omnitrophota bacterium]